MIAYPCIGRTMASGKARQLLNLKPGEMVRISTVDGWLTIHRHLQKIPYRLISPTDSRVVYVELDDLLLMGLVPWDTVNVEPSNEFLEMP